jgi:hypothetical protein
MVCENPFVIVGINLWNGLCGNGVVIIGPFVFERNVNGQVYLKMINQDAVSQFQLHLERPERCLPTPMVGTRRGRCAHAHSLIAVRNHRCQESPAGPFGGPSNCSVWMMLSNVRLGHRIWPLVTFSCVGIWRTQIYTSPPRSIPDSTWGRNLTRWDELWLTWAAVVYFASEGEADTWKVVVHDFCNCWINIINW